MPDWIFWVALGWMMLALGRRRRYYGSRCGAARLHHGRHRRERREMSRPPTAELPPRPPTPADLEAGLRSRYVSGELSVEEYERELDRLYRRA